MKVLILCTSNLNRSKTAELHFRTKDASHIYCSAGLSEKECNRHKTTLCTEAMLEDADIIFVMEDEHVKRIQQHTGERFLDKVFILNIPDVYKCGEDALIERLDASWNEMQFEVLFAHIASSSRAARHLFDVSDEELAATYKPGDTETKSR
ncbi:hypothetical protein [Bowmanella sp. JS7-9]|uniref:Phosphotyrosine protein phosphatase I domain-containing protein n=1 Tax=Pseudobowmanella zhangzhouensis TaxID=1537679 RepID=A0ABW1XND3_9ALTE|nr:hypothetical protein [Bowmanella sp. JS7-9]